MAAGGNVATTALIDLYSSPNPVYRAGPSLAQATKYLSHATLLDGRVLLAGGQDPQGNPVFGAQLYRPISNSMEAVAPTTAAHQYHSNMWLDQTGRAILVGGNPRRGSVQRLVERFEPWYVDVADRPQITSAPATIAHNQPFTAQVQLAAGTTLKHLRVFRLMSTTHQFGAAEGDFTLTSGEHADRAGVVADQEREPDPAGLLLPGGRGLTRRPLDGQDRQGHLGRRAPRNSLPGSNPGPSLAPTWPGQDVGRQPDRRDDEVDRMRRLGRRTGWLGWAVAGVLLLSAGGRPWPPRTRPPRPRPRVGAPTRPTRRGGPGRWAGGGLGHGLGRRVLHGEVTVQTNEGVKTIVMARGRGHRAVQGRDHRQELRRGRDQLRDRRRHPLRVPQRDRPHGRAEGRRGRLRGRREVG